RGNRLSLPAHGGGGLPAGGAARGGAAPRARPLARDAAPRHATRLQLAGSRSSVCRSLFAPSHPGACLTASPLRPRSLATSEASYSPRIGQRLFQRLRRGRCPIASCWAAASAVSVPTYSQ